MLLTPLLLSASIATYVNGYLCSTYPDVQEVTNYEFFFYECPSSLRGGCAFQVYNKYNHYSEFLFEPGQNTMSVPFIFGNIRGYDVYFCDTECSCSRWAVAGGCGDNGCPSDKKYIERDCDPGCGLETTGCGYSCEVNNYCGDGACNNGENCDNCARDCGNCPRSCSSRHHTSCYHGNLWWYDSCGNREEIRRYCDHGCSGNSCEEPPEPEHECNTNCPGGWTCYKNSCYKDLGSKSWMDGEKACEDLKSHLVTINNAGENNWVDEFTRGDVWIGYNDRGSEGDWEWLHDSSSYKNWHNSEPNNAGNEDCAHMWSDGTWNDAKCGNSKTVVCEKEDGQDIVPEIPCSNDCTTNCPGGWSCRADSCYKRTSGSWTSIKSYCESLGAHIVTVNDDCENEWINSGWIGYHDQYNEGWWQWVNGSSSYTNWHNSEPNNAGNEDCTEVWGDATWNDAKCGNNRAGYCEIEDPCPTSCDDYDDCTSDSCSVTGCIHETISPCNGNGECEQGEHYCNSVDCSAPSCGSCQEVTCTNNGPECSYLTNCCGNNACEQGEDCVSCPGDCGCALGVNLSSVECFVDGEPCQDQDEILSTDTIITSFYLLNASHEEGTSVRVEFKANNNGLGGETVTSSHVTHSFSLPGGRQSVIVTADDLLSSESTNALLFSITIKEEDAADDGSTAYPFDYEQGAYQEDGNDEAVSPDYKPSSAAFLGGLGAAALAGLGGLTLSKKYINQGTYIPYDANTFLKESNKAYEESKKREELIELLTSHVHLSTDFINGFIFGSDGDSNPAEIAGDIAAGVLIYGDIRDTVKSLITLADPNEEFDYMLLSFSLFGLGLEFIDRTEVGDAFTGALKVAWKRLPKKLIEPLTWFFTKLGKNFDEAGRYFGKIVQKVPPNKLFEFLSAFGSLINKLIKFGDDVTIALLKKITGIDEVTALSKYVDNVGDDVFGMMMRRLDPDTILDLSKKDYSVKFGHVTIDSLTSKHYVWRNIDETSLKAANNFFWRYSDDIERIASEKGVILKEVDIFKGALGTEGSAWAIYEDMTIRLNINFEGYNLMDMTIKHELEHLRLGGQIKSVADYKNPIVGAMEEFVVDANNIEQYGSSYVQDLARFYDLHFTDTKWGALHPNNLVLNEERMIQLARMKTILENNKITNLRVEKLYNNLNQPFKSICDDYINKFKDFTKNKNLKKLFEGLK